MYLSIGKKLMAMVVLLSGICSQAQVPLQLQIDFSKATPLQRNVYGVNNEFIHPPYTPNFKNYKAAYLELGKPTFRYPAGTGANYINLATGFATGWEGIDAIAKGRMDGFNAALQESGKSKAGLKLQDFIQFMKAERPVCNYVLNVSSVNVADNRKILTAIKNSGVVLGHIELGNELFYSSYKSAFPDAASYITCAKITAAMVRQIFPDAKIAVGVPVEYFTNEVFLEAPPEKGNRLERWYHAIKKENFYDAIAVHMYAHVGMDGKTEKKDFLPFKSAYKYAIAHIDSRLQVSFDRMKADFPDKEIWLTEYHVGGFAGPLRQYRLRHTFLGGLFGADFLLKTFAEPQVTLSNWHSMVQFLAYEKPEQNNMIDEQKLFAFKTNYYFFKMFKTPVLNSTQYVPAKLLNVAKYKGAGMFKGTYDEVDAGAFYNDKTHTGYLVLLNKKSDSYSVNIKGMEKVLHGKLQTGTVLSPDTTLNLEDALVSETAKSINNIDLGKEAFELQPYSICVIEFKN